MLVSSKILIFMPLRFFSFHGLLNGAFSLKYRCIMSYFCVVKEQGITHRYLIPNKATFFIYKKFLL